VNSDSSSALEPLFLNCELVGQRFPFVGENGKRVPKGHRACMVIFDVV